MTKLTSKMMKQGYVPVLDHGFVGLVAVMGDDSSVPEAARLSIAGEGVKSVSEDRALVRYLLRRRHTTPFEMVEFKFHAKMPIFVARQWVRHRTASLNEMSARYSELPAEFYVPAIEDVKKQATRNKQGRSEEGFSDVQSSTIVCAIEESSQEAFALYRRLLDRGVARELARIILPLNTYTEWYWKIDLHNLFHFLKLRLDSHAQYEIRVYAEAMAAVVRQQCPEAWEAFEDYQQHAMQLSRQDVAALRDMLGALIDAAGKHSLPDFVEGFKTKREAAEFTAKLDRLGIKLLSSKGL